MIGNGIGTTPGDDVTFTTLAGSGGTQPGGPAAGAKKFCRVPKVVGQKINKARRKVVTSGCKVKVVYKYSKKKKKGIVLLQSRKAKKKLVYRAVVKLTVSTKQLPKKAKKKTTIKKSSLSTTRVSSTA